MVYIVKTTWIILLTGCLSRDCNWWIPNTHSIDRIFFKGVRMQTRGERERDGINRKGKLLFIFSRKWDTITAKNVTLEETHKERLRKRDWEKQGSLRCQVCKWDSDGIGARGDTVSPSGIHVHTHSTPSAHKPALGRENTDTQTDQ